MADYIDYGPVRFRFESSQRKNDVVLYDSELYRGKTSEWFLARKNNSTVSETYRCVHCRCLAEKNRKTKTDLDTAKKAGARIVIKNDRFMTDPDFPLGGHICKFENNVNCDTALVWGRRALLRANTELRATPEIPKVKFENLIQSIQNGTEYAHLDHETRQHVADVIKNSKNGFDSRRRSFARNNSIALQRMMASSSSCEESKRDMLKLKLRQRKKSTANQSNAINQFSCDFSNCGKVYLSSVALSAHKRSVHFLTLEHPHSYNIKGANENVDGVEVSEIEKVADLETTIIAHANAVTLDIEDPTSQNTRDDDVEIYGHSMAPSPDHFMGSVNSMLDQIYEYSTLVSCNSNSRDLIFTQLNKTLQLCAFLCQQEGFVLGTQDDSTNLEDMLEQGSF